MVVPNEQQMNHIRSVLLHSCDRRSAMKGIIFLLLTHNGYCNTHTQRLKDRQIDTQANYLLPIRDDRMQVILFCPPLWGGWISPKLRSYVCVPLCLTMWLCFYYLVCVWGTSSYLEALTVPTILLSGWKTVCAISAHSVY